MKKLISIVLCIVLCGCALMHEQAQRELDDTQIAKQTAHKQFLMTAFHIAVLKAYMAERMNELPASTVAAVDLAEQMALNYDPNTVTDTELGTMFGLRAKIFCDLTMQIVGPELSRYLP